MKYHIERNTAVAATSGVDFGDNTCYLMGMVLATDKLPQRSEVVFAEVVFVV